MIKFNKFILIVGLFTIQSTFISGMMYVPQGHTPGVKIGKNDSIADIAVKSLRQGAANGISAGISNTVSNSLSGGINLIPKMFNKLSLILGAYFHKIACGSQGLNPNILGIYSQEISRAINPLTQKSHGNNDKIKRMMEISQEMNNDVQDAHWLKMQETVLRVLDRVKSILVQSIPCYSLQLNPVTGVRRVFAYCASFFTIQDNEQIRLGIAAAIRDISIIRGYVSEFKSWKEVEQNIEHTKRWLAMILGDLNHIKLLIDGESPSRAFAVPAHSGQQVAGEQLSELLSNMHN